MIQSRFLQTPTGKTYDPARDIERSFDKTTGMVVGAIEADQKYKQEQEVAFGQILNNIGEIEGVLQEEYNGLNQQMIDSIRELAKNHYKKGGRSSDPEFQATYGQMVGRVKAGISNADNIREQIDMQVKELANNPYVDYYGKNQAVTEMLQMARNPDVLISKNPIDFSSITQKYVNPDLVFKESYQKIPSLGETEVQFSNDRGDLMSRKVSINELVNSKAPFDANGGINLNLTPEKALEILDSDPMVAAMAEKIRKQKYPNDPYNVGLTKALRDGYSGVAGMTQSTRVVKSAGDIKKENALLSRQNQELDLKIRAEERKSAEMDNIEKVNNRYQEFSTAVSSGDIGFFGEYNNQKAGISEIRLVDKYAPERKTSLDVSTKEGWSKLSRDERVALIENLGVEDKIDSALGGIGKWETNTEKARLAVKTALDEFLSGVPSGPTSIGYRIKTGTKEGEAVYEDVELPIGNQDEVEFAFRALENLRSSGKGKKEVNQINKPTYIGVPDRGF